MRALRSANDLSAVRDHERCEPPQGLGRTAAVSAPARLDAHDSIGEGLLLDREYHAESLASLAARALRQKEFARAFALADRRCRIEPIADASHFLLRATALRH